MTMGFKVVTSILLHATYPCIAHWRWLTHLSCIQCLDRAQAVCRILPHKSRTICCGVGKACGRHLSTTRNAAAVVSSVFQPGITRVRGRQGSKDGAFPAQHCTPGRGWEDPGKRGTLGIPSPQRRAEGVIWRCQLTALPPISRARMGVNPSAGIAYRLRVLPDLTNGRNARGIRHWCLPKALSESALTAVSKSRGLNSARALITRLVLHRLASNVIIPSRCRSQHFGSCKCWVIDYSCKPASYVCILLCKQCVTHACICKPI